MHPICHVFVAGFHHTRGCEIEFCYPPFNSDSTCTVEHGLPQRWSNLPFLALPDASHNSAGGDVVYFLLPSLERANHAVFGIACYKQIDSHHLVSRDHDVTRNQVQKSVGVISKLPIVWGTLREKLELITEAYFNERDFSKVDVLKQMWTNMGDIFANATLDIKSIYMGVPLELLFRTFRHRTLELFKLLLLEKRVVFEIRPTSLLCDILTALISLFPCLLDGGLFAAASYNAADTLPSFDSRSIAIGDALPQQDLNPHGFPLNLFTKGNLYLPYACINDIEHLRADNVRAFCIGVTNSIFRQQADLYDVYITLDAKGLGSIVYADVELQTQAALTMHDTHFMSSLLKSVVEARDKPAEFVGNDEWTRGQFYIYLCAMLNATRSESSAVEFGTAFMRRYRDSYNCQMWMCDVAAGVALAQLDVVHPSSHASNAQQLAALVGRHFASQQTTLTTSFNFMRNHISSQGTKLRTLLGRAPPTKR